MGCEITRRPDGTPDGIVCSRGRRQDPPLCQAPLCITPSTRLCDWPLREGGTCDERMCDRHTYRPMTGKDYDLCPRHASEWKLGRKVVD
jgi:hypothetical protein